MRTLPFLLGTLTVGSLLLGGCGLKKQHRCKATATYEGKDVKGEGSDVGSEKEAAKFARNDLCQDYCMMQSPDVERAFQAETHGQPKDRIERIQIVNNEPVVPVLKACRAKCDDEILSKGVGYVCSEWGI
jgi:hypothetical protein